MGRFVALDAKRLRLSKRKKKQSLFYVKEYTSRDMSLFDIHFLIISNTPVFVIVLPFHTREL